MPADLDALENAAGYCFGNRDFLIRALTHTSHAYEKGQQPLNDNEQLEFLGALSGRETGQGSRGPKRSPGAYREGRLSIIKNYLVSASHLHEAAQKLELGEYLLLGRGEELSGGRVKKGLLADAVEALIAAIYLDGGIEAAREFVVRHVFATGAEHEPGAETPFTNFKGALQEIARSLDLPSPRYSILSEHGPAHARRFTVEVRIGENLVGQAEGDSKKAAGQMAARAVFEQLMEQAGEG